MLKNQLNLNSVLLVVIGALVSFILRKADDIYIEQVHLRSQQIDMTKRMDSLELKMEQVVIRSEFIGETQRLNREIDSLKKKVNPKP